MNEFARFARTDSVAFKKAGLHLFTVASILAGTFDLIWGDFDVSHQPIGSLGIHIPGLKIFAYVAGTWLILAGSAIFARQTVRTGIFAMAAIYFIFGTFSLPRFYTMTQRFGFHITVILGVLGEMLQQLIVVAGCVVLYTFIFASPVSRWTERALVMARWTFGLSGVLFGLAHLTNTKGILFMIPKWMPLGAAFWVIMSGIGFILAGLAILTGILALLATRLLTLMLLIFEVILVPIIFGYPHVHQAWGASAYNLTVAGAVLMYAASLQSRRTQQEHAIRIHVTTGLMSFAPAGGHERPGDEHETGTTQAV
jgi:hypothetical protein